MTAETERNATYAVTIPTAMTEALAGFLRRSGVEFSPMDMALRLNGAGNEPEVLQGHEAPDLLEEINGFLRKRKIHPLVPGGPEEWTPGQMQEFLELAMEHFSWEELAERPSGAWWLDEGVTWREVAATFRELFGGEPGEKSHGGGTDSIHIRLGDTKEPANGGGNEEAQPC